MSQRGFKLKIKAVPENSPKAVRTFNVISFILLKFVQEHSEQRISFFHYITNVLRKFSNLAIFAT